MTSLIRTLAVGALLLLVACKKQPVKQETAEGRRLAEYCGELKVGAATPEIPAWIPQQGSRPNPSTVELILGGKGMNTCFVTIDANKNVISAVRYQPD